MSALLTLEEAQARLLALAMPLPVERVDVDGALGRYLAEPLVARRTQPSCDVSAMDGYAVAAGDLAGPWQVIGESAAGHPFCGAMTAGQAVRISTGAVLPADAAVVIVQEDTARDEDHLTLTGDGPSPPGKHIRRRGLDFTEGKELLASGARIGPAQIALALAAGRRLVAVRRSPRVVVIDSGDELAADCEACAPHQVPASNGAMLAAQIASALPCQITRIGPVADRLDALADALARAAAADVIITSGGASVGDHDLLQPALAACGARIDFWKAAIKPGKPLLVATREGEQGRQIIVGLPGNPVASHITALLFAIPLLRAMMGAALCLPKPLVARAAHPLRPGGDRREFLRATWDGAEVTTQTVQDSGALASLSASNALIDRPAGAPALPAGAEVPVYLLGNGGIT